MRKMIKTSMIFLLTVIAGTATLAAKEIDHSSTDLNDLRLVNDREKEKKKEKAVTEGSEPGKPFFRSFEDQVSLNLLNLDRNPVHIEVMDTDDRVLFTEIVSGELTIGKTFDFSKAQDGMYTIKVKDCENTYYKKVEKY